jgi:putative transposase
MQWLMTSHVRRYHRHYGGSGHIWQGRFKAFPIQRDEHLLTVLRYVERNAVRARLSKRAEAWRWGSLFARLENPPPVVLATSPVPLAAGWTKFVNAPQSEAEVAAMKISIDRGTPFGDVAWQRVAARRLGLQSTLRPRGRPRKSSKG